MIASLMMYARPELAEAHRRLWDHIRAALAERGIDSPGYLSQGADEFSVWTDPELVLSQTCGMPYRLWLSDRVGLVGTPDYGLAGCAPGYYRSPLVIRSDDSRTTVAEFRDATFAYNQTFSQSGFAAPYAHLADHGFWFTRFHHSGAHRHSAEAVADGTADIASLDVQSWRLMYRYDDFAKHLRVLDWTAPTPGLPLITAQKDRVGDIFDAAKTAIETLEAPDREALGLRGIVRIPRAAYLAVPNPPEAGPPPRERPVI